MDITDRRDGGRRLQVTWHAAQRVVVFSQWRDEVCVATTPVELSEVPRIIGLLVNALAGGSSEPRSPTGRPTPRSVLQDLGSVLRSWAQPHLASVIDIAPRSRHSAD